MANITASKTKNIYAPASSSYYYILEASFEETGVSTSNNTSTLSVTAKLTSHYINFGSGGGTLDIYWFDNNENDEGTLVSTKDVSSIALNKSVSTSDTIVVNHKSNGTLSGYAKAVWTKTSGNTYTPASNNVQTDDTALTSIAVAPVVTQTITSIQETSIGVRVSANTSIRKTQYCINANSPNPTYFNITGDSQSFFTIINLTANTTYYVRARVQGPDSDEYGYSNIVQLTTAQYPYLESISVNNLKAGNSQTVSLKNPLNRECIVYMKKDSTSGTTLNSYTTTSNGNVSFTPNATTLANSLPSSDEGNCVYYCYYSSNPNGYVSGKLYSGKYSLDNSQGTYNPTFDDSNWSYSSTNYSSLTNDSTTIIKGKSQIDFSVDTTATPATGTTISKYKIEWGTLSDYINSSTTGTGSLIGGIDNLIKVTAIDSRGNTTISQKNINLIDYFAPYMSSSDTEREDGIGTDTVLNLSGNFFNDTFGTLGEQNALASAKYYVSTDNETWSQGYTIPVNSFVVSNNVFTLSNYSIHANGSSDGFPIGTKYYLKVEITDSLSTLTETNIQVTDGKIARDVYQDSNGDYHQGINGLADDNYANTIHGDENIVGDLYLNGTKFEPPTVENQYSTSTTDSYSADYVNGFFDGRHQAIIMTILNLTGKNKFNKFVGAYSNSNASYSTTSTGFTITSSSSGTYRYSSIKVLDLRLYAGLKLTLSVTTSGTGYASIEVSRANSTFDNKTVFGYMTGTSTLTIDVPSVSTMGNNYFLWFRAYSAGDTSLASGVYVNYDNFQIELGDTATSYVNYKDYESIAGIEDCGTNNNGSYVKFSNGTAVCWKYAYTDISYQSASQAGTVMSRGSYSSASLPISFVKNPSTTVITNAITMKPYNPNPKTEWGAVTVFLPYTGSQTFTTHLSFISFGWWK